MTPPRAPPLFAALFGLRTRAVLVVLTLVLSLAMLAVLVVTRANEALLAVDRARFDAQTRQLADTIAYAVLARSPELLEEPLAAFARSPDLVNVAILDDASGPIAERAGPRAASHGGGLVEVSAQVETRGRPPGDDSELLGFDVKESAPRIVGSVIARYSSVATEQVQRRTQRSIVAAVASVGVVAFIAVAWLVTSLVRRIRRLQNAAARVRQGDLAVKVEDDGVDEIASLARDFNAMTASLDAQNRALAEKESLAALGRATAVIAHELKNPLGIVMGASEIAANEAKPDAARREAAAIVLDEVKRLNATLEGLLTFARPRAPSLAPVDVVAACEKTAARATLEGGPASGRAVRVTSERPQRALGDEQQLAQVLWNLVQNGAQAGARAIALHVHASATHVIVDVRDDGPGVPPETRAQLFVPFATTKLRGTGLGLAASRRMLRDMKGDLTYVESASGACFRVELPCAAPQEGGA